MKTLSVALGLSALVLIATPDPVAAAPFSDAFDGLQTELERRRDEDFEGALTRQQRRQRAAVLRSLALLARNSPSLASDVRIARVVISLTARAYREELLEDDGEEGGLYDLMANVTYDLRDLVNTELRGLEKQQSGLNPRTHRRVRRLIVAAVDNQINSIFSGLQRRALSFELRVLRLVARGGRIAARGAPGEGRAGVRARVTLRNFEATEFSATYDEGTGTLSVTGDGSLRRRRRSVDASFQITRTGVFDVGTYALTQGTTTVEFVEDGISHMLNEDYGSLCVTELDPETGRVAGVFDMGVVSVGDPDLEAYFELLAGEFTVDDAEVTSE